MRVRVPTLVIWGMRDERYFPDRSGLDEYVQDLSVVRIDDAGHTPMRSHPGAVNQAIRDFLGGPAERARALRRVLKMRVKI